MRLYESNLNQFTQDILNNYIADKLQLAFKNYYGRNPSVSEYNSWNNSLRILKDVFVMSKLDGNIIALECELPYTQKRIDVLVFGKNKKNIDNVLIIELKQWSEDNLELSDNEGNVIVNYGIKKIEQPHPSIQLEGYYQHMRDFMSIFDDGNVNIAGLSYCHNYNGTLLSDIKFNTYLTKFPIYGKNDNQLLIEFLNDNLSFNDGGNLFETFKKSIFRPSKKLLEHTRDMINNQQIFNLIDEQITAYNTIMTQAKKIARSNKKSVVIVNGGPGTGKSVIALEVMGQLLRNNRKVFHATGSSAFTNTLRSILGSRSRPLFKFFNSFMENEKNSIDILVCDEAHRIRKNSTDRYTKRHLRTGRPQIEELIESSKLSIFFIDDNQIVRPNEIGSSSLIKKSAIDLGVSRSDIYEYQLETQFRCGGSKSYIDWIDNLLDINPSDKECLTKEDKFEITILDSPNLLKDMIDKKNANDKNSAKIVAEFCWPWSKPNLDGSLIPDVKIDDFEMPWENKENFWKWATDDSGMDQVGTVYTAQGFEYDYIGVIFGNDLIYNNYEKKWEAQPNNSYDSAVVRNNNDLTKHLLSVYRVLLTRAHKGVYVYFMDESTKEKFKEHIKL